jgi:hypothetical protein
MKTTNTVSFWEYCRAVVAQWLVILAAKIHATAVMNIAIDAANRYQQAQIEEFDFKEPEDE